MKSTPSSTARRRTAIAAPWSAGSPQTPLPVSCMLPNPMRRTVRSPPSLNVPAAAAGAAPSGRLAAGAAAVVLSACVIARSSSINRWTSRGPGYAHTMPEPAAVAPRRPLAGDRPAAGGGSVLPRLVALAQVALLQDADVVGLVAGDVVSEGAHRRAVAVGHAGTQQRRLGKPAVEGDGRLAHGGVLGQDVGWRSLVRLRGGGKGILLEARQGRRIFAGEAQRPVG